jgi:hypothetical protein
MYIFRPHRSLLADAMAEAKEFNTKEEMFEYIIKNHSQNLFDINDLVIDERSFPDDRINWHDTHYVCSKRFGDKKYETPQCIGMCATQYEIK